MQLFLALEQIDAIFQSVQFKHLSTSDPERLPCRMLPCAPAHVKMQDVADAELILSLAHDMSVEIASDVSALQAARVGDHGRHGVLHEGRD